MSDFDEVESNLHLMGDNTDYSSHDEYQHPSILDAASSHHADKMSQTRTGNQSISLRSMSNTLATRNVLLRTP